MGPLSRSRLLSELVKPPPREARKQARRAGLHVLLISPSDEAFQPAKYTRGSPMGARVCADAVAMGVRRETQASVGLLGPVASLESSWLVMGDAATGCQGAGLAAGVSEMGATAGRTAGMGMAGGAPAPRMKPLHLWPALKHGEADSEQPQSLARALPSHDSFTTLLTQTCRQPGARRAQYSITACDYRWSRRRLATGAGARGRARPYNKMVSAARPCTRPSWRPWPPGASFPP